MADNYILIGPAVALAVAVITGIYVQQIKRRIGAGWGIAAFLVGLLAAMFMTPSPRSMAGLWPDVAPAEYPVMAAFSGGGGGFLGAAIVLLIAATLPRRPPR